VPYGLFLCRETFFGDRSRRTLQPAGIELSLNSKAYRQDGGHVFREMRLFFNVLRVEGASK